MPTPKAPILPANRSDPTGVDRLERGAMRQMRERLKGCRKAYKAALDRIPASPVANRRSADTRRYAFELDPQVLSALLAGASAEVDALLLEGGEDRPR